MTYLSFDKGVALGVWTGMGLNVDGNRVLLTGDFLEGVLVTDSDVGERGQCRLK